MVDPLPAVVETERERPGHIQRLDRHSAEAVVVAAEFGLIERIVGFRVIRLSGAHAESAELALAELGAHGQVEAREAERRATRIPTVLIDSKPEAVGVVKREIRVRGDVDVAQDVRAQRGVQIAQFERGGREVVTHTGIQVVDEPEDLLFLLPRAVASHLFRFEDVPHAEGNGVLAAGAGSTENTALIDGVRAGSSGRIQLNCAVVSPLRTRKIRPPRVTHRWTHRVPESFQITDFRHGDAVNRGRHRYRRAEIARGGEFLHARFLHTVRVGVEALSDGFAVPVFGHPAASGQVDLVSGEQWHGGVERLAQAVINVSVFTGGVAVLRWTEQRIDPRRALIALNERAIIEPAIELVVVAQAEALVNGGVGPANGTRERRESTETEIR